MTHIHFITQVERRGEKKKGRFNDCFLLDQNIYNNDSIRRSPLDNITSFSAVAEWTAHAEIYWQPEECGIEKAVMNKYDTTFFLLLIRWERKCTD